MVKPREGFLGTITILDEDGSGAVTASNARIRNVTDPVLPQDAATKNYVDSQISAADSWGESLANGNTTDGYNPEISSGDRIQAEDGYDLTLYTSSSGEINLSSEVVNLDAVGTSPVFEINPNGGTGTIRTPDGNVNRLDLLTGDNASVTGELEIRTGDSSSGTSGWIRLETGAGDSTSGDVELDTGDSASGATGYVELTTGTAATSAGSITLTGGQGGQYGGHVNLQGGRSLTYQGANVTFKGGQGATSGGDIIIEGGKGDTANDGYIILKRDGVEVARWNANDQLDVAANRIIDVQDPVDPQDAATKAYVDGYTTGVFDVTNEPSGFPNTIDSTISIDDGTRTFTIQPTGSSYDVLFKGRIVTKAGTENVTWTDVEGLHFFYFDTDYTLKHTVLESEILDVIYGEGNFISALYWDGYNDQTIFWAEERHGFMPGPTHAHFHLAFGAQWISGGALSNMSTDGLGSAESSAQFGVGAVTIRDEDLSFTWTDGSPQTMDPVLEAPIYYRDGASGDWRKKTADGYNIIYSGTAGYTGANGRVAYNEDTGSTWQLTEVGEMNFVLVHYYATDEINEPIIGIQGQAEYNNIADASAGARNEINDLQGTADLLSLEHVALATVIYQTSLTYSNTPAARIRQTEDSEDYIDWRGNARRGTGGVSGVTIHANLSGLAEDDHLQYLIRTGIRPMTGNLDMGGNDIVEADTVSAVDGYDLTLSTSADGYTVINAGGAEVVRFGLGSLLMQFGDSDDAVVGFPATASDGKSLSIRAQSSSTGDGGNITLESGTSGDLSDSGHIILRAADSNDTGSGGIAGSIRLIAGYDFGGSPAGGGGEIEFWAGESNRLAYFTSDNLNTLFFDKALSGPTIQQEARTTSGNGATLWLIAQSGNTSGYGGSIRLRPGIGAGGSADGIVYIDGRRVDYTPSGSAGTINQLNVANGDNLAIQVPGSSTNKTYLSLAGGDFPGSSGNGGSVVISAGDGGTVSGDPGDVTITSGNSVSTDGGEITLIAGDGDASSGLGGDIFLKAGDAQTAGNILLVAGDSYSGVDGYVGFFSQDQTIEIARFDRGAGGNSSRLLFDSFNNTAEITSDQNLIIRAEGSNVDVFADGNQNIRCRGSDNLFYKRLSFGFTGLVIQLNQDSWIQAGLGAGDDKANLIGVNDYNIEIGGNLVDGIVYDSDGYHEFVIDDDIVLRMDGYTIDANTQRITNVVDPIDAQDAATKAYVDGYFASTNEWSEVLANGNTSGGTNPEISNGDQIQGESGYDLILATYGDGYTIINKDDAEVVRFDDLGSPRMLFPFVAGQEAHVKLANRTTNGAGADLYIEGQDALGGGEEPGGNVIIITGRGDDGGGSDGRVQIKSPKSSYDPVVELGGVNNPFVSVGGIWGTADSAALRDHRLEFYASTSDARIVVGERSAPGTKASDLILNAQRNSSATANSDGGDLRLQSGDGEGGIDGYIIFSSGTQTPEEIARLTLLSGAGTLEFDDALTSVNIRQRNRASGSAYDTTITAQGTANGYGGDLVLEGGQGSSIFDGGDVILRGGEGGSGSPSVGDGSIRFFNSSVEVAQFDGINLGTLEFVSGLSGRIVTEDSASATGALNLFTGDSSGSGSGTIWLKTGTGTSSGSILGQTSNASSGGSGNIQFLVGDGVTSGGVADLEAGNSSAGTGGSMDLYSGDGYTGGGMIRMHAGDASYSGSGGEIQVWAGHNTGTGNGGAILAYCGNASNGYGGNALFNAGNGSDGGGSAIISGGNATGTGNGGYVQIKSGAGSGGGTAGDIYLQVGGAGTFTLNGSTVNVHTQRIENVVDPVNAQDAATKNYVDGYFESQNEWSEVLANGNTSGGTDPIISTGDTLYGETTLNLYSGDGATGSALNIRSGAGSSGSSGPISISSGFPSTGNTGGSVSINTSAPLSGAGNSGLVSVSTGTASSGNSGVAQMTTGNAQDASGKITLRTGIASASSGTTGEVDIDTGNATGVNGNAGNISLTGGNANAVGGEGGIVTLTAGDGYGVAGRINMFSGDCTTGTGGAVSIYAGAGVPGGTVSIYGGNGASGNEEGGHIIIDSGSGSGAGWDGYIYLKRGGNEVARWDNGGSERLLLQTQVVEFGDTLASVDIRQAAKASGSGTDMTITAQSAPNGIGGDLVLEAGASSSVFTGGNLYLRSGEGGSGSPSVGDGDIFFYASTAEIAHFDGHNIGTLQFHQDVDVILKQASTSGSANDFVIEAQQNTSGSGGDLRLKGGQGSSTWHGGDVFIESGEGGSGSPGAWDGSIYFKISSVETASFSGRYPGTLLFDDTITPVITQENSANEGITFTIRAQQTNNGTGGNLDLIGGSSTSTTGGDYGGDVNITSGAAGNSGDANTGNINITSANVNSSASGAAGNIVLAVGDGYGSADNGSVTISAGDVITGGGQGGVVNILGGNAITGGSGNPSGDINILAGSTGASGFETGNVTITAGNHAGSAPAGNVTITGGEQTGTSGNGGSISITGGESSNGDGGSVTIAGAEGSVDDGYVIFKRGSIEVARFDGNGFLDVNANRIVDVQDPVNPQDAATKNYVDGYFESQNEWSEVLANGATSGGTNPIISTGDVLQGESDLDLQAATGTINLSVGATQVGEFGDSYLSIGTNGVGSGSLRIPNNTALTSEETGGTDRDLIKMNSGNQVVVGSSSNVMLVYASTFYVSLPSDAFKVTSSQTTLYSDTKFLASKSTPVFGQEDVADVGETLTVQAQNSTGSDPGDDGGDLILSGGSSAVGDGGDLYLKSGSRTAGVTVDGYVIIQRGTTEVARWGTDNFLDVNANRIVDVQDPVNPQDAATKAYVDSQTGGSYTTNINETVTSTGSGGDTLVTYNPNNNSVSFIDGIIIARGQTSGDSAGWKVSGVFEDTGGTLSRIGSASIQVEEREDATWDVDISVTGSSITVDVTGDATENVVWRFVGKVVEGP